VNARKRWVAATLALVAGAVAISLILLLPSARQSGGGASHLPSSRGTTRTAGVDASARVAAILEQMHEKAFNPQAPPPKNSGGVPGGTFINWGATWDGDVDTAKDNTDFNTNGQTDSEAGLSARHDEFTDLLYLRNLLGYRAQHPADHSFDSDIIRMEPVVKSDFRSYTYYKCSLYGELEDMQQFDPTGGWGSMADTYAAAVLSRYYSTSLETVVEGSQGHYSYRVDYAAECAAMFVDAGKRLNNQPMVQAGVSTAQHLLDHAVNPTTHLLPLQMSIGSSGAETVAQSQIKVGDAAQMLDALLHVYDLTHDSAYLDEVSSAVHWMFASPLHDQTNGGFYFSIDVDGTGLQSSYKESRQAWMLPLLEHLDRLEPGSWTAQVNEMLGVVRDKLWQPASEGYVYRVTPSFAPFQSHDGVGGSLVTESWVTAEAMDIAAQALEGNGG
jgi:hypothetical protein